MTYLEDAIREEARVIAAQAQAIADGTVQGPLTAAALRLHRNTETLVAWTKELASR